MIVSLGLTKQAEQHIARMDARGKALADALADGLEASLERTERHIAEEELTGQALNVRTGALRRSIAVAMDGPLAGRVGVMSDTVEDYAAIQEFGGTIRPKRGKYLAVPLDAAKTSAGVIKGQYNVASLRELDLVPITSKRGTLLLCEVRQLKTKRKIIPLFALKKEVTIEPKHYIADARQWLRRRITRWLKSAIKPVLKGG